MKLRNTFLLTGLIALLMTGTAMAGGSSFSFGYHSGYRSGCHSYYGGYSYRPSWSFGYTWGAPVYYWYPPPVAYSYYYRPTDYSAPRYYYRSSPPVHYYQGGSFYTY
jgi:hypothetical protein